MGEEINDDGKRRLDRIEEGLQMLAKGHLQFQQEYRKLIKGLELRQEPSQEIAGPQSRIDEIMAQLAASQRNADEKLAALLVTVKLFRGPLL